MKPLLLCTGLFSLLLALRGQAQCTTSLVATQACTAPGGATPITDAGGGNTNVTISGGAYVYRGSNGISNLNLSGGTLYYTSNATLNNANISGGTLIYSGTGSASGVNQAGGTIQVCGSGQLTLTGNLNGGAFVVAAGGRLTLPNAFSLQNSSQFTNYGTLTFQSDLTIASGSTGVFVNAGTLTASGQVFLNGPGFVNQGTASFGTLVVNGSGKACLAPRSQLSVTTFQTNDSNNSFDVQPANGALACVRITNGNSNGFNAILTASLKLGICKAGTVTAQEQVKYGTAQVTQNCNSCQTVLPVVLTSFTATAAAAPGGPVALRWRTASEVDHAGFVVERSLDGHTFLDQSALLPAQGGQQQGASYAWADADPQPGQRYYRLRLLATDGSPAQWSPTAAVLVAAPSGAWAWAYPPDADHLHLDWLVDPAAPPLQVAVVDIQGRRCQQYSLAAPAAGGATLPLAGLAPGAYWLRLEQGGRRQLLRFARP